MTLRPLRVAPELVDLVWRDTEPLLAKAVALNGCLDTDDVREFIRAGAMDLLVVEDAETREIVAALTTEIQQYPKKKALRIVLAGGERLSEWMDSMHALIEDGARRAGCEVLEIIGRGGWVRALKKLGYGEVFTTIQKSLEVAQ